MTVDRTEVSVFVSPFVPDCNSVVLKIFHIGITRYKPQEFVYYGFKMHLLGGEKRETFRKVETHLVAEHALGAGAGAVAFHHTVGSYMPQQI